MAQYPWLAFIFSNPRLLKQLQWVFNRGIGRAKAISLTILMMIFSLTGLTVEGILSLKEILKLDQEPRNRIVTAWQEHPQDTILHQQIGREIWHNDSINLIRVLDILENYNLDFGEENEVLWAVIQHSSLELQQKYLPKFIAAAHKGKIRGELIAVMQDRIACWSGKLQLYGSQGNIDENVKKFLEKLKAAE